MANVQCSRRRDRGDLDLCRSREGTPLHCTAEVEMQCKCAEGSEVHTRVLPSPVVEWRTLALLFDGVGRLYTCVAFIYNFENL